MCQNPPPQLSKIIFVTGSTEAAAHENKSGWFGLRKTWRYKPAKPIERGNLCRSLSRLRCFVHARLNCLTRQATQAKIFFCMQRGHWEMSLFRSMNLSRQSSRQSLPRSTITEINYVSTRTLRPFVSASRGSFFLLSAAVSMKINFRVCDRDTTRNKYSLQCKKLIYSYVFILPIHFSDFL